MRSSAGRMHLHTSAVVFSNYTFNPSFAPGDLEARGYYNAWKGFAVQPAPAGSPPPAILLRHIEEVICGGNQEHYQFALGWMAHLVQPPGTKTEVALVLRGQKGSGNSTFGDILTRIFGRSHATVATHSHNVVGNFNAHLRHVVVLAHTRSAAGSRPHRPEIRPDGCLPTRSPS